MNMNTRAELFSQKKPEQYILYNCKWPLKKYLRNMFIKKNQLKFKSTLQHVKKIKLTINLTVHNIASNNNQTYN
jgi:hypothetical protein